MKKEMDAPWVLPEHLERQRFQTQRWERKEFEGEGVVRSHLKCQHLSDVQWAIG